MRPESLADGGCWISDDRVYAFVSARGHGLTEIGYHGLQPVSRNSRLLVHPRSVLGCFVVSRQGGGTVAIPFDEIDWEPGCVRLAPIVDGHRLEMEIRATGRRLIITFSGKNEGLPAIVLRFTRGSLFTEVQGERHWEISTSADGVLHLSCRDQIMLDTWIRRAGPYSGDFLIPEPWRRLIYSRNVRSGEATVEDLKPEYRDLPIVLYDATTHVSLGGKNFSVAFEEGDATFTTSPRPPGEPALVFEVGFEDDPPGPSASAQRKPAEGRPRSADRTPRLDLPGYPQLSAFFAHLPDVVDSCVIGELGVPRASAGRYYWVWAWDLLVTAVEMLRWGDVSGARHAARFVSTHRDLDGRIPSRWTRALEPLDTPAEGAGLEFLLAHLCYELYLESGSLQDLLSIYPTLVSRFRTLRQFTTPEGLILGTGFYPDLPGRFGRTTTTATAIETGCWFGLCRILQNLALLIGDPAVERESAEAATTTGASFLEHFWDHPARTIQDAVDHRSGTGRHPIFSYLSLQSPLALTLVREKIPDIARFIRQELLTQDGLRTIPLEERGDGAEVILDAWYPHWDLYALKILRRAGDTNGLLRWLSLAERTLEHLGYCPEYLGMEAFRIGDPSAWTAHGAASNLNCATAWYRALLETVLGVELDPGGLTVASTVPLSGRVAGRGLHYRGGLWDVARVSEGPFLTQCIVDGTELRGLRKLPRSLSGPGRHRLELHYGQSYPGLVLEELLNAEILEIITLERDRLHLRIRVLGPGELRYNSRKPVTVTVNGSALATRWNPETGSGWGGLQRTGTGDLEIFITGGHA